MSKASWLVIATQAILCIAVPGFAGQSEFDEHSFDQQPGAPESVVKVSETVRGGITVRDITFD